MKEFAEFRIPEAYAKEFLSPEIGRSSSKFMSLARIVRVPIDSELYEKIGEIYKMVKKRDQSYFFLGWDVQRTYLRNELRSAKLLFLKWFKTFEPTGAECGTVYDSSKACNICGAGIEQLSDLVLDLTAIPKNINIGRTLSDEIIVDQDFINSLIDNNITGYRLGPVRHKSLNNRPAKFSKKNWHQLIVTSTVNIHPLTKTGEDPFDEDLDNRYRCPKGHTIGLDILSELSIREKSWDGSDFVVTKELIGINQGLLRTSPLLLISQKLFRVIEDLKFKGIRKVEVVRLLD